MSFSQILKILISITLLNFIIHKTMQDQIIFYSHRICPFAQRVWITLQQLKIAYAFKQVSFIQVEPFFKQIYKRAIGNDPSSQGKVPVLVQKNNFIAQSKLICWYLAQKYDKERKLIFRDDLDRMKMRLFIQNNIKIVDLFYRFRGLNEKTSQAKDKLLKNLDKVLQKLDKQIILPYALGQQFSLADILIFPWIARWPCVQKFNGVGIDTKFLKVHIWIKNIMKRPSVQATMQTMQYYNQGYKYYFQSETPIKNLQIKSKL